MDNNTQTPQPNHEQRCPTCGEPYESTTMRALVCSAFPHGTGQLPEPDVYSTKPLLDKSIQPEPDKNHGQPAANVHETGESVDKQPTHYKKKNGVDGYYGPDIPHDEQPDTTSITCGHCGRRYRLADGHSCKERLQPKTPQSEASGHGVNGLVGQPDYTSAGEFEQQIENELMDLQRISFYDEGLADTTVKGAVAAILAAHNQAIRAELQALASSNNWRVQLESRMAALDKDKEFDPEYGDESYGQQGETEL